MRFEKIFWMEDHPDDIGNIVQGAGLDLDRILERTTFAHDFREGELIVPREDFDLYILDGDFPDELSEDHARSVDGYMEGLRNGVFGECIDEDLYVRGNNFARFYQELLEGSDGKKVVYSGSIIAPYFAFHLDLPFYAKGSISGRNIRNHVKTGNYPLDRIKRFLMEWTQLRDYSEVEDWECGGAQVFAHKYLAGEDY